MVVDGSLDLPSLDEGMASILYAFAGFSFPFQGGFDGGHMFGTYVVSVNSSQRWATTTTPIRSRVVSKDAGHWLFVMSDSVVWYSSSQRPSLPMDKKSPPEVGQQAFCIASSRVSEGVSHMRESSWEGWEEYVIGVLFGWTRAGMSGRVQRLGLFLLEGV